MKGDRGLVLVVDDEKNMRTLLRDILAGHHDVVLAEDGSVACEQLEALAIDVVLTDVRMPGLDGFELVRFVKRRWPLTGVVMTTAYASVPAAVEAMREGAYDYLQKPFDPDDVCLIVARALADRRERLKALAEGGPRAAAGSDLAALSYREALASARDRGSREYLRALLEISLGNVTQAAERAGLERESLYRLLRRYGIHAGTFRDPSRGEAG